MISDEAKNQFQDIITHEMFEMGRTLAQVMNATISKAASQGLGQSGVVMTLLAQDATNSLKSRAQFILGQLLRCLAAHRVALGPTVVEEASNLLRDAIDTQAQIIGSHLFQFPVFMQHAAAGNVLRTQFGQEGPRLVRRLTTELKLAAAASLPEGDRSPGGASLTFNGPVALVQTGHGSQATVNQHLDAGIKGEVLAALQEVLVVLDKPESRDIGNRTQLREIVVEAKAEVEKQDTNVLKLGSSLRTIAETIKFVGSLRPAYQVLKPLLSYFGIHLP